MTSPVPQGYPDYGRLNPIADLQLVNDTNHSASTPITYGPFYVALFRALYLRFSGSGGRSSVDINSLLSNDVNDILRTQTIPIGDNQVGAITLRPFTPWVSFVVRQQAATTISSNIVVSTMADADVSMPETSPVVLVSTTGQSIAATTTVTINPGGWHIGEAYFFVGTNAASWAANVQVVNVAGGITVCARAGNGSGQGAQRIFIPPGAPQVTFQNGDAATRAFDFLLIAKPNALA